MRSSITVAVIAVCLTLSFALAARLNAASSASIPSPDPLPLQEAQPPAKITVDAPDPSVLKRGGVYLRYHVTNIRLTPVLGPKAVEVTPRLGHLHVTVDDAPWHWVDFGGGPVIVFGLPAGPHKIELVLADPNHNEIDHAAVSFTIPETKATSR